MAEGTCRDCGGPTRKRESRRCRSCVAKSKWADGTLRPTECSRVTLTCEVCAVGYEVIRARASSARACSHACANELRRRLSGETHPHYRARTSIACEQCGETFDVKPCHADGSKRFCSRRCVGSWVTTNQPRVSSIEVATAQHLDSRGIVYRQQVPLVGFVADFVVGSTVIEVDGSYWHSLPVVVERDRRKDAAYASAGFDVIRLPEEAVRAGDFTSIERLSA